MAKLTLQAEGDIIAEAKRLAAENGTSVSSMFSRFIQSLVRQRDRQRPLGRITRQVSGVVKMPEGATYKDILADALVEKYKL